MWCLYVPVWSWYHHVPVLTPLTPVSLFWSQYGMFLVSLLVLPHVTVLAPPRLCSVPSPFLSLSRSQYPVPFVPVLIPVTRILVLILVPFCPSLAVILPVS